jgi:hypothetical protein
MWHLNYVKRRNRGGKKLLPPNPTQWECEHKALDLRDALAVDLHDPLDHAAAFSLLPNVVVVPHGALPAADKYLNHFRGVRPSAWSGLAVTIAPDFDLVIYNDSHRITRVRATLLEEFFHLWIGHPKSVLRMYSDDGAWRSYNSTVEQEAYGSGAAALVPYAGLVQMINSGRTVQEIASHFEVSEALVLFRGKVTKTYRRLRRR